jgi:hypothetical protein
MIYNFALFCVSMVLTVLSVLVDVASPLVLALAHYALYQKYQLALRQVCVLLLSQTHMSKC